MTAHASSCTYTWDQGAATELGARHEQQDRWGLFQSSDPQGLLAILADGMGGHLAGEVASRLVVETMADYLSRFGSGKNPEGL